MTSSLKLSATEGPGFLSISPSDSLLSSVISLPENPQILYSVFTPSVPTTHHECIELARRHVLSRNASLSILNSILRNAHWPFARHAKCCHRTSSGSWDRLPLERLPNLANNTAKQASSLFERCILMFLESRGSGPVGHCR